MPRLFVAYRHSHNHNYTSLAFAQGATTCKAVALRCCNVVQKARSYNLLIILGINV